MNTSAVAKMLGVSPSTIQRWVKQANLQMERTELGHFQFSEESIEVLKDIQEQLNNGVLLQDLKLKGKKPRRATVALPQTDAGVEKLLQRMDYLENKLNGKADDVVSYQILQHRREIEELKTEVARLNEIIEGMQQAAAHREEAVKEDNKALFSPVPSFKKLKKRSFISSFFGI